MELVLGGQGRENTMNYKGFGGAQKIRNFHCFDEIDGILLTISYTLFKKGFRMRFQEIAFRLTA